jgi:hypothetical protein
MELTTATHFATVFICFVVVLLIIAFVVADYMATKAFPLPQPNHDALEDQIATLDQIDEHLTNMWLGLQPEHRGEFPVTQEDIVNIGELIDQCIKVNRNIRGES